MKMRPLSKEDIGYVLANIHDACLYEIQWFNKDPMVVFDEYRAMIGRPFSASFVDDDGECQAIFFLESLGDMKYRTHFTGTKNCFDKIGRDMSLFLKQMSDDMVSKGVEVETLTPFGYGKMHNWMLGMGFTKDQSQEFPSRYVKGGS